VTYDVIKWLAGCEIIAFLPGYFYLVLSVTNKSTWTGQMKYTATVTFWRIKTKLRLIKLTLSGWSKYVYNVVHRTSDIAFYKNEYRRRKKILQNSQNKIGRFIGAEHAYYLDKFVMFEHWISALYITSCFWNSNWTVLCLSEQTHCLMYEQSIPTAAAVHRQIISGALVKWIRIFRKYLSHASVMCTAWNSLSMHGVLDST